MKSECLTYLKSKGKAMAVTLSDDEVSDDESECDENGNFIAFTATAVVNKSISTKENPSNGELSEDADLQEAYNKFCKVAAKDAMNVNLGLKNIESLELDKKNLLVKLFDANELLNNVKIKNMLLLDKVKSLELDLSVARSASSKLDQLLGVQKSHSDKSGLSFVESISVSVSHSTHFVPSSSSEPSMSEAVSETVKPPVSEVVKPIEVSPSRKIRVDLKNLNLRSLPFLRTRCMVSLLGCVIFVGNLDTFVLIVTSCKLLREQTNQKCKCLKHKILQHLLVNW